MAEKPTKTLKHFWLTPVALCVSICLLFLPAAYADFGSYVKVNDDATEYDQLLYNYYSQVCISGTDVFAVWLDGRAGAENSDIYFSKGTISPSGEFSFAANTLITDGTQAVKSAKTSGPAIAVDDDGVVYIAWSDARTENPGTYLVRSTDGGASFLPEQFISADGYPKIAVSSGYVYIACSGNVAGSMNLYISTDSGQNFNDPVAGSTAGANNTIAASGDYLYIAKIDSNDVYLTVSSDHGQSFSEWKLINDDGANTNIHSNVVVAAAGSNVYLAWHDRRETNFGIYMATSNNNGATFGSNVRLSPPAEITYNQRLDTPSIAAYGNNVAVGFKSGEYNEIEDNTKAVLAKVSFDAGATWTDEAFVSPVANLPDIGPLSITINDQAACIFWQADSYYFETADTGRNVYANAYKFVIETDDDDDTGDDDDDTAADDDDDTGDDDDDTAGDDDDDTGDDDDDDTGDDDDDAADCILTGIAPDSVKPNQNRPKRLLVTITGEDIGLGLPDVTFDGPQADAVKVIGALSIRNRVVALVKIAANAAPGEYAATVATRKKTCSGVSLIIEGAGDDDDDDTGDDDDDTGGDDDDDAGDDDDDAGGDDDDDTGDDDDDTAGDDDDDSGGGVVDESKCVPCGDFLLECKIDCAPTGCPVCRTMDESGMRMEFEDGGYLITNENGMAFYDKNDDLCYKIETDEQGNSTFYGSDNQECYTVKTEENEDTTYTMPNGDTYVVHPDDTWTCPDGTTWELDPSCEGEAEYDEGVSSDPTEGCPNIFELPEC